jgi:hypothetical protein
MYGPGAIILASALQGLSEFFKAGKAGSEQVLRWSGGSEQVWRWIGGRATIKFDSRFPERIERPIGCFFIL